VVLLGTKTRFQQDCGHRYRISLEQHHYASTTINLRLAAVRRLAYEAADCGLLSADFATGIRRVKGAKRLSVPVGNWLTAGQGKRLLSTADSVSLRGKRDYATLAILLGCGLRRAESTALSIPSERVSGREGALSLRSRAPSPPEKPALPSTLLVPFYSAPVVSFYSGLDMSVNFNSPALPGKITHPSHVMAAIRHAALQTDRTAR